MHFHFHPFQIMTEMNTRQRETQKALKYYTHSLVFSIRNSWAISPKKLDFDILVLMSLVMSTAYYSLTSPL